MSELRQRMIAYMRSRQLSPRTEHRYLDVIAQLSAYHKRMPDRLSRDEVVEFLAYCAHDRQLSYSTVNVYFQACRFLYEQVLSREQLTFKLPRRSRSKTRPRIYSPEECRRILEAVGNLKHKALLYMVYGSGMRVSEVVRLRPEHIQSRRMLVFIVGGKGRKDRYTLLSAKALDVLRAYWRRYHPGEWLFPSSPERGVPLGDKTAQHAYYNAVRKSGLQRLGGIHTLRHCFATHLMEQGVDIYSIQRWMGHISVHTTSGYMHVRDEHLRKFVSPLDMPV